jgi:hypothetical protein
VIPKEKCMIRVAKVRSMIFSPAGFTSPWRHCPITSDVIKNISSIAFYFIFVIRRSDFVANIDRLNFWFISTIQCGTMTGR